MNIKIHHSGSQKNLYQIDNLLVDPGISLRMIKYALDFRVSGIEACLCTHSHNDHSQGLRDLMKAGIDCYCSEYTAQALNLSGHRLHIVEPMVQFGVGKYKIKPFGLVHDVPNMGFLVSDGENKCLIAVDTNYIPHRFNGLTHIILGIDYDMEILQDNMISGLVNVELSKRVITNHMSLETAIKFFQANDLAAVKEIHIVHLSALNGDPDMFKDRVQRATGRPVCLE